VADRKGICWRCEQPLAEVYPAINGTPGFYVCDTPGCPENYAENCARESRENCEDCAHWFVDKYDAIGMGNCVRNRTLTAPDESCGWFSGRPNTRLESDRAIIEHGGGE